MSKMACSWLHRGETLLDQERGGQSLFSVYDANEEYSSVIFMSFLNRIWLKLILHVLVGTKPMTSLQETQGEIHPIEGGQKINFPSFSYKKDGFLYTKNWIPVKLGSILEAFYFHKRQNGFKICVHFSLKKCIWLNAPNKKKIPFFATDDLKVSLMSLQKTVTGPSTCGKSTVILISLQSLSSFHGYCHHHTLQLSIWDCIFA